MMFKKHKQFSHKRKFYILGLLIICNGIIIGTALSHISSVSGEQSQQVLGDEQVLSREDVLEGGEELEQENPTKKLTISVHTVVSGDTLSSIAEEYGVSVNTIRWANELTPRSIIKEGQQLTILPVSGVQYKVGKGDSLITIAKQYGSNVDEIRQVNDLDGNTIKIGQVLIIPNAMPIEKKVVATAPVSEKKVEKVSSNETSSATVLKIEEKSVASEIKKEEAPNSSLEELKEDLVIVTDTANNGAVPPVLVSGVETKNYFTHPVPGSILTQGRHGFNSVDFGAPRGTPILAAADGVVIVEKGDGKWYGGYGNYIVIAHDNGTQTLYSHNTKNIVSAGDIVKQGQQIATVGSTGRSTGPHLHFEVRGGTNPWVGVPKGTQF